MLHQYHRCVHDHICSHVSIGVYSSTSWLDPRSHTWGTTASFTNANIQLIYLLSSKAYFFFVDFFKPASRRESKFSSFFFVFFGLTAPPPDNADAPPFSFPSSSYPLSDGKQVDGSETSGCFEVTCSMRRGGFAFTMKVWRQMVHMKALASCFALAAAAFRSSSDFPCFFWFRSRAA